jgi:hypothetical protein
MKKYRAYALLRFVNVIIFGIIVLKVESVYANILLALFVFEGLLTSESEYADSLEEERRKRK